MQALNPFFRPKNRPYRTETLFPIPCYNRAMKNSEVGMVNGETENSTECWSAGVMGTWSILATHHPARRLGCRILEQKHTKETKRQSRFWIGTSFPSFASVQNQAQSSLIKPNQSVSQSLPPGHRSSLRRNILWPPWPNAQPMVVAFFVRHYSAANPQSAIRNPLCPSPATLQFRPNQAL